jgi:tetratricopeptide (TPR) repeat protein
MSHCYRAWAHWFLGFQDAAVTDYEHAIQIAKKAAHPLVLAQALCFGALVHRYRGEPDSAEAHVQNGARLSADHSIPYWNAVASALNGWLEIEHGKIEEGAQRLAAARTREREAGLFSMVTPIVLADLIDAYIKLERFDRARAVIDEARALGGTKLIGFGMPDILRLEGELFARQGEIEKAEACFAEVLALSRSQNARSLELRTLVSVARLDRARGRPIAPVLAETYRWFTEGFAARDLTAARELLGKTPPPVGDSAASSERP